MSDIVAICELEPEKRAAIWATKGLDYFKQLKDCPDPLAKIVYEEAIKKRWEAAEEKLKVLEELVKDLKYDDNSVEEDRYEIVSELVEKAVQGFDIQEEHASRRILYGHRIVLEVRMLVSMNNAFDRSEKILRDFYSLKGDRNAASYERDDLRQEIRCCDAAFSDAHMGFLASYLNHDI